MGRGKSAFGGRAWYGCERLRGGLGGTLPCGVEAFRERGASRPHETWHNGREPRVGEFGALCKGVAVDGRLFAGIRMRAGRPRSRVGILYTLVLCNT